MYLKALEIQGFKSFPDKTVLNFGEDITAIVGPNGSGKSNISDAIRWVMGEQSSKALRGGKMEDVIFGGTEKRAPVGFAQVTLVLDNTGQLFPSMEETEVAVTRRYYRSGESEYYINRQSVRLKDVTELFMDTGMGREGYSIVGQGRVDEILSTKSTDRREIFEEAAGISKFRHRKEEAERKLERTEENLVRINDKIAELELQVEPLRAQAETAKKYLVLRDEMRVLEISLWLENLETLKANARKLEIDLRNAERERDEAQASMDALFAENEQFGQRMQEKDIEAETLRKDVAGLDAKTAEQDSAVAVLESSIYHLTENIRRAESELEESESRTGGYEAQAAEQDAKAAELEQQAAELNAELDALLAQAQAASEQAGGAAAEAEALRGREAMAIAAAADARAEAAAVRAETEQIKARRTAAAADKEAAERQLEEKGTEARSNRRALEDAQDEAEAAANIISGHALRMEERKKKAAAAAENRVKLTMDTGALDNRIRLLTEMEKDYEGFNKAVKLVCQAQNHLRGIHGPVASLMKTDGKYSLAIEIALGAGLQNIVVDREEDAKSAIAFLKQRDGGRATFLPLTAIRGDELRERGVEQEFGFVGVASRLVRFDPKYTNIFNSLLGRTVIAEDLDCGIAMASGAQAASQVAQLVLLESDFSGLPAVVAEGRRVINNIQRSASLFLVKNIFSFLLTFIALFITMPYPLQPLQLSLLSMVTIGIPSFILALEPNHEMVHGKFIQNVLRAALPGGLSDLLLILGIEAFVFAFELPIGTLTTLTTLLLLAVGMAVLWDVCKPFTVAHGVLWGGMLILAGAAIALLGGFLGLERLDMRGMLILIAFLLLVVQTLHSMERGLTAVGDAATLVWKRLPRKSKAEETH